MKVNYPRYRRTKWSPEVFMECLGLYENNMSPGLIEHVSGPNRRMVTTWAKEAGIARSLSESLKAAGIVPPSQKGVKRSMETRLKISGDRNHFWRGGVAPLRKRIRMSLKTREWRRAVFERDEFTCQKCGRRSMAGARLRLNAHHRVPFVELLRKFGVDTFEKAMACEAIWMVNNGVTLCVDCH